MKTLFTIAGISAICLMSVKAYGFYLTQEIEQVGSSYLPEDLRDQGII